MLPAIPPMTRFFAHLSCIVPFALAPLAALGARENPGGVACQMSVEGAAPVREVLYDRVSAPPPGWKESSGALRLNADWELDHSKPWFIEYQMQGGQFVSSGALSGNRDAVKWGLKIIEWGFSRMEPDGRFDHPDSYHSGAFFIESTAHGLLFLESSPLAEEFRNDIRNLKPRLLKAARWMMRPEVHAYNWPDPLPDTELRERKYAHRRYLNAAAVGETGILCGDKDLVAKSAWFVNDGIAFQQPDGVNPERWGHDTSYQAVGLMYACRYYRMVADDALRARMFPMMTKGFDWLLPRIQADGSVDMTGNTRTGPAQELSRAGKPKGQDYRATVESLANWGSLTGSAASTAAAERVAAHIKSGGAQ